MMKTQILIVDKDKQLTQINQKILRTAGIAGEVHITENGKEAIDYLKHRIEKKYSLPDIVLLELHMPVMDGFQFLDAFEDLEYPMKHNIEIVVFTSSSNPKDMQKAFSKGIRYYLNKPYLLRGLNDVIRTLRIEKSDRFYKKKPFGLENIL